MIDGLQSFVGALRRRGVSISPAEWLDALRAVERCGVEDRSRFRAALRCALVKRQAHRGVFDELFKEFFRGPARSDGKKRKRRRSSPGSGGAVGKISSEPSTSRGRLRKAVARSREGASEKTGRMRQILLASRKRNAATLNQPGTEVRLSRRDLRDRWSVEDERGLVREIPRWVGRIRFSAGRRYEKTRRGRLYPRRLFRENLRHGGVPFRLPRRRRTPRRNRVVLLIDVSWSVARAAGLFLSIAGEFLRHGSRTEVLLFVDRVIDATPSIESWLAGRPTGSLPGPRVSRGARPRPGAGVARGGRSFAALLDGIPALSLDAPSDYGRAFHDLARSPRRTAGRNSVLLVLGDGRTNRFDPQAWAFEEITRRYGRVIWLVPEPAASWDTGDSALGEYLPHVDTSVEARDLEGLARGVAELVRRL